MLLRKEIHTLKYLSAPLETCQWNIWGSLLVIRVLKSLNGPKWKKISKKTWGLSKKIPQSWWETNLNQQKSIQHSFIYVICVFCAFHSSKKMDIYIYKRLLWQGEKKIQKLLSSWMRNCLYTQKSGWFGNSWSKMHEY